MQFFNKEKCILPGYENERIVVFDGVCNFCHSSVNFIIEHDAQGKIKHTPAQSAIGQEIQKQLGIDVLSEETSIFYDRGYVYTRCYGGLQVCKYLDPWWLRLCSVFRFTPKFILDPLYNFIAKNRYQWYGKKEQCMIPSAEVADRFL